MTLFRLSLSVSQCLDASLPKVRLSGQDETVSRCCPAIQLRRGPLQLLPPSLHTALVDSCAAPKISLRCCPLRQTLFVCKVVINQDMWSNLNYLFNVPLCIFKRFQINHLTLLLISVMLGLIGINC